MHFKTITLRTFVEQDWIELMHLFQKEKSLFQTQPCITEGNIAKSRRFVYIPSFIGLKRRTHHIINDKFSKIDLMFL